MKARVATAALLALLAAPAAAQAHATLERTAPAQGATVAEPPREVEFHFSEPVEASFGALRVFDAAGDEVQSGELLRPGGESSALGVALPGDLPDGSYTATYEAISADSHPVSGGFVFSVGAPGAGPSRTVAELLDRDRAGPVTGAAFWADRLAGYVAIAIAIGCLAFLLAVWRPAAAGVPGAAFDARLRRALLAAAGVGLAAALLALPLQAATATGSSLWSNLEPDRIREVLDTRFGTVNALRAGAWALLGALVAAGALRLASPRLALAAAAPVAMLALAPGLAGHAAAQDPSAVLLPADAVHVSAMSVWAGGIFAILVLVPAATRPLPEGERSRLLDRVLARFSPIALWSVIALAAAGILQTALELERVPDLVETAFGRTVLVKVALLAGLVGLGAANRRRILPALSRLASAAQAPGSVGRALRRNLRAEIALLAAALAAAALLVGYSPSGSDGGGPVSGRTEVGANVLEYTLEPARVGPNQLHIYLFDAETGAQFDGARETGADVSLPDRGIGPLPIALEKAGPGHYVAPAASFGVAGDWELRVTVRTSRFQEDEAKVEVPVE